MTESLNRPSRPRRSMPKEFVTRTTEEAAAANCRRSERFFLARRSAVCCASADAEEAAEVVSSSPGASPAGPSSARISAACRSASSGSARFRSRTPKRSVSRLPPESVADCSGGRLNSSPGRVYSDWSYECLMGPFSSLPYGPLPAGTGSQCRLHPCRS